MKKVPSLYILLMDHIYPFHKTQVAEGTVFWNTRNVDMFIIFSLA